MKKLLHRKENSRVESSISNFLFESFVREEEEKVCMDITPSYSRAYKSNSSIRKST